MTPPPRRHLRRPPGTPPVTLRPVPADLHRAFLSLLSAGPRARAADATRYAVACALRTEAETARAAAARQDALFLRLLDRTASEARRVSAARAALVFSAGVLAGLLLTLTRFFHS